MVSAGLLLEEKKGHYLGFSGAALFIMFFYIVGNYIF